MMQKGTIEINDNTYSGTLYYSGDGNNEVSAWFHGKLIFELPVNNITKRGSFNNRYKREKIISKYNIKKPLV